MRSQLPSGYNCSVALGKIIMNQDRAKADLTSIQQPITDADPEVRQIIEEVLKLEKDKLYLKTPRNINDDILKIIKHIVR